MALDTIRQQQEVRQGRVGIAGSKGRWPLRASFHLVPCVCGSNSVFPFTSHGSPGRRHPPAPSPTRLAKLPPSALWPHSLALMMWSHSLSLSMRE